MELLVDKSLQSSTIVSINEMLTFENFWPSKVFLVNGLIDARIRTSSLELLFQPKGLIWHSGVRSDGQDQQESFAIGVY